MSREENNPEQRAYEFGDFRLDTGKRLLTRASGVAVPLMPKAFDTLLYLLRNGGRLIDKDELLREIWPDTIVEENNLTQNISILRRALGEKHRDNRFIATVPGHGYKFVADVREAGLQTVDERPEDREPPDDSVGSRPAVPIVGINENTPPRPVTSSSHPMSLLALIALLGAALLGTIAYLVWPQAKSNVGTPVTTVAVLPFRCCRKPRPSP